MLGETAQNKSQGLKLGLYKGDKIQQRENVSRKQYTENCHQNPTRHLFEMARPIILCITMHTQAIAHLHGSIYQKYYSGEKR